MTYEISSAALHTAVLYGSVGVSLAANALTLGGKRPTAPDHGISSRPSGRSPLWRSWSRSSCAAGSLIVEWLLPGSAALAAVAFGRSRSVVLWCRRCLV